MKAAPARVALVSLLCVTGCPTVYMQQDGWLVRSGETDGGKRGSVHPAVLEHVLLAEEAPFVRYYQAILDQGASNRTSRQDLADARRRAAELAPGEPITGRLLARARARQLIPLLQKGFALPKKTWHKPGSIFIICCSAVDRETGAIRDQKILVMMVINQPARVVRMQWLDGSTMRNLTWDLADLPEAFDPSARLAIETVARRVRPLHPVQEQHN